MPKDKPEIRFAGYTDAWEKRKFSEGMAEYTDRVMIQDDKDYPQLSVSNKGKLSLRGITNGKKIGRKRQAKINLKKHPNTLVFTRQTVEQGGIGLAPNAVDGAIVTENMPTIDVDTNVWNIDYLTAFFNTSQYYKNALLSNIEGGSAQVAIHEDKWLESEFSAAEFNEQNQIGTLFLTLNNLIVVNQRKVDLLKELKKGFLQKMFPKNGEDKPEIRFSGFTDAWKGRKAKDLFIPVNERNREDLPVLSVTQDQGVVFRNDLAIDIKYDESTLSSYKVIHPGDFVISLRSFQGGFELSNVLGISSPAYTIFDFAVPAEQDKLYWKTIFKTFKFIESLKTVTFGIRDGKSISFKEFGDLKLNYPSDVDEQRRIGEFFAKLDETIAANQRRVDLLKQEKKALLQKMFV